jgi:VanZ family protein
VVAGPDVDNIDKVAHFGVFGLLGTLLCRVRPTWRGAGWALLAASAFGATDEWHQASVPGRTPDLGDWIADTLGAALAVSLYVGWGWYRRLLEWRLWPRPARQVEKS